MFFIIRPESKELLEQVAKRLRQARNDAKLSTLDVEKNTGLSKGNVSSWENGKFLPGAAALVQLSELYKVSVDWILKGDTVCTDDKQAESASLQDYIESPEYKGYIPYEMVRKLNDKARDSGETQKIEAIFDPDLKEMIDILKDLMESGDPDIRGWTKVQFKRAFAEQCAAAEEKKQHA